MLRMKSAPVLGTLEAPSQTGRPERILMLADAVAGLFEEYRPNVAVIETAWIGRAQPQAVLALGEIRGALMYVIGRYRSKLLQKAPASAKQALTGKGNASKQMMIRYAELRVDWKGAISEHAADALGLALCGWHYLGYSAEEAGCRG